MKMLSICSTVAFTLALLAGCNGADSGTGANGAGGSGGNGGGGDAPAAKTIDDIRKALGLTQDPVDIEESMEEIDDLIYDEAWTAESEDRIGDAVEPLLKAEHFFRVTEPEHEAHKTDAKFQKWMQAAADQCAEGAAAAHAGDRKALLAAFEKLDKSCETCHKVYRKKKK